MLPKYKQHYFTPAKQYELSFVHMSSVWCQVCVEAEPTVTSIEHRLISNHRHFHCLSNSLFGKESITSPQWGNSTGDWHIPLTKGHWCVKPGGCFTNVSRALQNNLAKIYNARNHIYGENFKLKLCTCAQSHTQVQILSLKFSKEVRFLQYTNFEWISWRARETLVKQPPALDMTSSLFEG